MKVRIPSLPRGRGAVRPLSPLGEDRSAKRRTARWRRGLDLVELCVRSAPPWKVSSLGGTVLRLCGAITSRWLPQRSRPLDRALRRRPARQALSSTAAFFLELACASHRTAAAVARYPNPSSGLEVAPGAAKVRPEKGPIGLVRGGRREPISRQPPRADFHVMFRQTVGTGRGPQRRAWGRRGRGPMNSCRSITRARLGQMGVPGGRRFGWLGQASTSSQRI